MASHPEHQRIAIRRWHRLLTAAPTPCPIALAMSPRDPISDQYRRVHLESDRAAPLDLNDPWADRKAARTTRCIVACVVLGLLINGGILYAVLS